MAHWGEKTTRDSTRWRFLGPWVCAVQVLRARSWEGAAKRLLWVWKDEFASQGIRVSLLHQGTASDTGNSMGFGIDDENWGP